MERESQIEMDDVANVSSGEDIPLEREEVCVIVDDDVARQHVKDGKVNYVAEGSGVVVEEGKEEEGKEREGERKREGRGEGRRESGREGKGEGKREMEKEGEGEGGGKPSVKSRVCSAFSWFMIHYLVVPLNGNNWTNVIP
jgi:hypothetical protein